MAPAIDGQALAAALPTDSVVLVLPDGTASFTYSDPFRRNFRGRRQLVAPGDDVENLLDLPPGYPKPKLLLDAHELDVEGLVLSTTDDILWWAGDITYKFDLGFPTTAFRLASADGRNKTTLGDPAWEENGRGVEILASNDAENWIEIWRSHGKGEVTEVEAELPPSLLGQPTVYLKFRGQEHALIQLHVSASLDARPLAPLVHLEAGHNELEFTDAPGSSHKAIIFWQGCGVRHVLPERGRPEYPASKPRVVLTGQAITILFPQQVGVTLRRSRNNGIAGIQDLLVGRRTLVSAPGVRMPAPALDILSDDVVGGVTDWTAYLAERAAMNDGIPEDEWTWPRRGGREGGTVLLDAAEYLGYRLDADSVVVRTRVNDGRDMGEVDWVFSPVSRNLGGRDYRGIGWKVRVAGLEQAVSLRIIEPATVRYGDWAFAQVWGNFIESPLDFSTHFGVPGGTYFGDTQPFYFAGGPGGAAVSFFDAPVAAEVAVAEEAGRHLLAMRVPLGAGSVRQTPMKIWMWTDDPFSTKWTALDEWTAIYDATAKGYRSAIGLGVTPPQPVLLANVPSAEYMERYWEDGPPAYEDSFHYVFAHSKLQTAAAQGFRVLIFDMHWDTDALYVKTPAGYLPGSLSFGSGNAPWRLEINDALGGEAALRELSDRAHDLGVAIVLWIPPDHLSNSSPLLQEHPEWIKWRNDGTPETAGYGDITGTSLSSGWYGYATGQYRAIHRATGFDGVLVDSWLTFAMLPDGAEAQPAPQLDQAIALQRDLRQMGMTQIHIEGTSPFGLSSGGYGLEGYVGDDPEAQAMAIKLFRRIQGREYGLYRYVADTIPAADSYYRALASKGVIGILNLDALALMPADRRARIVQANRDYLRVLDKMERRHLVADGDTWQGVAWTRRGSPTEVLFAFEAFRYPVPAGATIEDITAGTRERASAGFDAEPMHTYVITRSTTIPPASQLYLPLVAPDWRQPRPAPTPTPTVTPAATPQATATMPTPGSCIPSGDDGSIQRALTAEGSAAVLCQGAVFDLSETVYFTHDHQEIYTQGHPTDDSRALLRVVGQDIATAVSAEGNDHVSLRSVIIDGNRPQLGLAEGALINFGRGVLGRDAIGHVVEGVKAYEPRGWTVIYLGGPCRGAVARNNEVGPAGRAEYIMADGISLDCADGVVENNTIVDVTDGGIVIFQSPGALVANNTIRAEGRVMFYGISMEDYLPLEGDFTGTRVTDNIIDAAGAMIRRGIGMGPYVGCASEGADAPRSRGAVVKGNTLMGNYMAYGYVISGVEDWTVTDNLDLSTHLVPDRPSDCFGRAVEPPAGFQFNAVTSSGTFQPEFEAAVLGGSTDMFPLHPVASEACMRDLIGAEVFEDIKAGNRGELWPALEAAPNGERIGRCISVYEPPDISGRAGRVEVQVLSCAPSCVELKLTNMTDTDPVDLTGAEFLLDDFLVPCAGLPASLAPWEEARCTIDDFVIPGSHGLKWFGFPPGGDTWIFDYPFP